MKEITEVKAENYGLSKAKSNELTEGLNVAIEERKVLISQFEEIKKLEITEENIPKFKELRLKLVKNRTQGIVKWHKANKDFFLCGGRFVDAIKNREIQVNESMEKILMNAEKHFENLEKERLQKLQEEREKEISAYVDDIDLYKAGLSLMSDEIYKSVLAGIISSYNAKIEAEKQAEKARIEEEKKLAKIAEEERKEQERIRKENEILKKEAEAREKARLKEEAERKAKIEAERKERERLEKIRIEKERAEREKLQAKIEAERKERERLEKIEQERIKKIEAEQKAKEEAERKLALAPDKDKLRDFYKKLNSLSVPELSKPSKRIEINIENRINEILKYIVEESKVM